MELTYEHHLSRDLGVSKETLRDLRRDLLTRGPDWEEVSGKGIALTKIGLKKIKAALAPPALPSPPASDPPAAPAPGPADFTVTRVFPANPRIVEGRSDPATPPVNIRVRASDQMGLRPGDILPACIPGRHGPAWVFTGRRVIR